MRDNSKERAGRKSKRTRKSVLLGAGAGIIFGAAFGNAGIGMVLGAGVGLVMGAGWDRASED